MRKTKQIETDFLLVSFEFASGSSSSQTNGVGFRAGNFESNVMQSSITLFGPIALTQSGFAVIVRKQMMVPLNANQTEWHVAAKHTAQNT